MFEKPTIADVAENDPDNLKLISFFSYTKEDRERMKKEQGLTDVEINEMEEERRKRQTMAKQKKVEDEAIAKLERDLNKKDIAA